MAVFIGFVNKMENLSENLLRKKFLFRLSHKIDAAHQKSIIEEVVQKGTDLGVWYSYLIRGVDGYSDTEAYNNRLNVDFPWSYQDTPITGLVQELLTPVSNFFTPTRIKIFVQKPHEALIEHCDKLEYRNNLLFRNFLKTDQFHDFFVEPHHEKQACLALKIPLSEKAGDNGKSYIRHQGSKYYIRPGNHYYLFNESRLRHGADPCAHFRGVMFIDGRIDLVELEKDNLLSVPVVGAEHV